MTTLSAAPLPEDPGKLHALFRQALCNGDMAFLQTTHGNAAWQHRTPAQLSRLQIAPGVVRKNVREVVAFLLAQGLDPLERSGRGWTLFHHVFKGIRHTRNDWIEGLLEAGVPLNWPNEDGQTILSMAVISRDVALVQRAIDEGVMPSSADRLALKKANCRDGLVLFWNTFGTQMDQDGLDQAFLRACQEGLTQQAEALLDVGAQPFLTNEQGWSALTLLGKKSTLKAELVQRLIALGVDPGLPAVDIFGKETTFNRQVRAWVENSGKKTRQKWRRMEVAVADGKQARLDRLLEAPCEAPARKPRM